MAILRTASALLLFLSAVPAAAECALTGSASPPTVLVAYDPFSPRQEVMDFTVHVRNTGDSVCQARLFIRPGEGGKALRSPSATLAFRLDGQQGAGVPRAGEVGPYVVLVPAKTSADIDVRATLAPQQVVPRDTYVADFALRLEDEEGGDIALTGANVTLQARVPGRTEVSITGNAGSTPAAAAMAPAAMNFGAATEGQTERVFVNVWSNGSVAVSLASENNGVLRLVQNPALPPIAYSARFDGGEVSLADPVTVARTPSMSLAGASYELALTLHGVAGKFAGLYKDVVTITVTQN